MAATGSLFQATADVPLLTRVVWCNTFLCNLMGLMFRRGLEEGEGLLLVAATPSRLGSAIHMFFMFFPIATIWMDSEFCVVDKALAKPWVPMYVPRRPAMYTLESSPSLLDRIEIGDTLRFEPHSQDESPS